MSTSAKIFGLAGTFSSGKDSLAYFLEENYGVKHISTSDILRELAQEKYGSIERPILYKTADELRTKNPGVLSEMALERYENYQNDYPNGVCVSGLRAWAEAEIIRQRGGLIIFTDAPAKLRYERSIERARDNEKLNTFEEFLEREKRENGTPNSRFSLVGIQQRADILLENPGDMEAFLKSAVQALGL